jgi:hypothetical protein
VDCSQKFEFQGSSFLSIRDKCVFLAVTVALSSEVISSLPPSIASNIVLRDHNNHDKNTTVQGKQFTSMCQESRPSSVYTRVYCSGNVHTTKEQQEGGCRGSAYDDA